MTSKRKLMLIGLAAALALVSAGVLSAPSHTQVIGTLARPDLTQVLRLVRQDLRARLLPKVEWDGLRYPRYVISGVREYHAQRILWVEAHNDGHVEVFAGLSRAVIRDEGYHWQLRRSPSWTITGGSYWAYSNGAPADMHVPPSP